MLSSASCEPADAEPARRATEPPGVQHGYGNVDTVIRRDGGRSRRGLPGVGGQAGGALGGGLGSAHASSARRPGDSTLERVPPRLALRRLHGTGSGPRGGTPVSPAPLDRASFYISDRSQAAPAIYQYILDHAEGHTLATMLDTVRETFKRALEAIGTTPPETVGPAFFGLIRLDEFVATRVVETVVHGMDLTDALEMPPLPIPKATPMAAEILDELVARRTVPGRPANSGRRPGFHPGGLRAGTAPRSPLPCRRVT
jgi:hypothetical protein